MALATIENVTAAVGGVEHRVRLTVDETGLTVGSFGVLPWRGSEIAVEPNADGCDVHLTPSSGVTARFFIPVESFRTFGGARAMKTFATYLLRSAVSLGAREAVPAESNA